jgi:hypothetical protein
MRLGETIIKNKVLAAEELLTMLDDVDQFIAANGLGCIDDGQRLRLVRNHIACAIHDTEMYIHHENTVGRMP